MDWTILQRGLCGRGACSEWASGLSLAAEQSIGRSQEAWIGRFYKMDFVEEGHVQSGQVGFPLLLNKTRKWVEKFGSATIHVVCGLAQPSYFMGHILEEPHEHADVSTHLGSPRLLVLCQRHGGWGATGTMLLADGKRPLRYTNNPSEQHST